MIIQPECSCESCYYVFVILWKKLYQLQNIYDSFEFSDVACIKKTHFDILKVIDLLT